MNPEMPIQNVSDTAFWVAFYRAKESERADALFHDPFAKALVGSRGKEIAESMDEVSRYTEWSVVSRTVIIDRYIDDSIKEGVDAVVNLGAGLDARPYRMDLPPHLEWVEVDQPQIIRHKVEALKSVSPKCKLTRVEINLADTEKRQTFLKNVVPHAKKVLILTEGVIPYLSPEQVSALGTELHSEKRFAYWVTEFFHPRVYPHLKKALGQRLKNAPFLFFPEDWMGFFQKIGWTEKEIHFLGEIAAEFKRKPPMPKWVELIFPFFPTKMKEAAIRMTGYMIFKRA